MGAANDWKARIESAIFSGMTAPDVDRLMEPLASDRAEVPLGGTGARALVFRLEGKVDAWFQLDGEGRLVLYGVYDQLQSWTRNENGILIGAAATPAVSLILAP